MYVTDVLTKRKDGGVSYKCTLLRESYRVGGKVKSRTIANLTHLDPAEIEAIRLALKHKGNLKVLGSAAEVEVIEGKSVGAIWTVYQVAKRLGIDKALGGGRQAKLALWQVIARVINQGSRLSAVRIASGTAASDILGLTKGFNENDLYENLAYLDKNQADIEKRLFLSRYKGKEPKLFLYDVTSSYFEGNLNELSAFGYDRDGKRGKKQVVVGLLCDETGDPVSVKVFDGGTRDFDTFSDQLNKARYDFGALTVTFVGDRGMIKHPQIMEIEANKCNYITAITKPQIKALIKADVIQLSLFDENLTEIEHEGVRYILRRNPNRAQQIRSTRLGKKTSIKNLIDKKNTYLKEHKKAGPLVAKKEVETKIKALKVDSFLYVQITDRCLELKTDEKKLAEISRLDGCYCLKTNLAQKAAEAEVIHDRYKDLAQVEEAFRTSKTAHLEMRPWYVRSEKSTRGHALVVILSYLIVRRLKEAWINQDITVEEGLKQLSTLCSQKLKIKGAELHKIPVPRKTSAALFKAAGITLPEVLPDLGARVVSRRKLTKSRKKAYSSS